MVVVFKILQVILALSVLVAIHEFGHFLFAKIFGIRVDKFFLFFDVSGVKLFSSKSAWFTKIFPKAADSETEYGIGWLPLGGYCKINGMVDESFDVEGLKEDPKPWEFRSKKAWKRLLVMAGGVMFNFILAIIAYTSILSIWGESYIANEGNAIYVNDLSYDMGFRNGDRILDMDGYVPENFGLLQADLVRRSVRCVNVLRDGDTVALYMDSARVGEILNSSGMFQLAVPFVIDSFGEGSPNAGADLQHGDRIFAIDSIKVDFVQDARPLLDARAGSEITASILRGADTLSRRMIVDDNGLIGVVMETPGLRVRSFNFLTAIPQGCARTWDNIAGYVRDLRLVAKPSTGAYKSVGSFISIGQVFPSYWDWYQFLELLAMLSIMLGVMNLLPIPGLDGGHILFTICEMVTGHKPSERFLIGAQMVGMVLLLMLMALAFGNDIVRLIR